MKMSTKGTYGLRAVMDIAENEHTGAISVGSIASREEIPLGYLEQLMRPLKKAGIVKSVRGMAGGYMLARKSTDLTVGDVLRAVGEEIEPVDCSQMREKGCASCESCKTRHVWDELNEGVSKILDGMTIASLLEKAVEDTNTSERD